MKNHPYQTLDYKRTNVYLAKEQRNKSRTYHNNSIRKFVLTFVEQFILVDQLQLITTTVPDLGNTKYLRKYYSELSVKALLRTVFQHFRKNICNAGAQLQLTDISSLKK